VATFPPNLDHLVYAAPDLERGIREIEELTGVRAFPGGQHAGRGTRNALIALGSEMYLEIIGPDPDQPSPPSPRWFGIDQLDASRLVTWGAKTSDVDRVYARAIEHRIPLGGVKSGSRLRSDGVLLSWRYTEPEPDMSGGIIPFFIDWGQSSHPSRTAATGLVLVTLRAEHPDEEGMRETLKTLGVDVDVVHGTRAALSVVLDSLNGAVELR
jgi:hypothetical protein